MLIPDNTGSSEDLLSKTQAAQRLGVSVRNLDYRIKDGSIPFVKIGRLLKFIPSDLERYIQAHRIGGGE
jgi:excisionase family DNA binding protein